MNENQSQAGGEKWQEVALRPLQSRSRARSALIAGLGITSILTSLLAAFYLGSRWPSDLDSNCLKHTATYCPFARA